MEHPSILHNPNGNRAMYNNFSRKALQQKVQKHANGYKEYWRNVPGYEGLYRVSDWGRVKSVERKARIGGGLFRQVRERILKYAYLKPGKRHKSYLIVILSKENQTKIRLIHRLVLEAFIGSCPQGMETCHNDGNPQNNRLMNLRWDTHQENSNDTIRHGTRSNIQGENHYGAKLTEVKVLKIRQLFATGRYSQKRLSQIFGVGFTIIHKIIRRLNWKHI